MINNEEIIDVFQPATALLLITFNKQNNKDNLI